MGDAGMLVIKYYAVLINVEDALKYESLEYIRDYSLIWGSKSRDEVDVFLVSEKPEIMRSVVSEGLRRFRGEYDALLMGTCDIGYHGIGLTDAYFHVRKSYTTISVACNTGAIARKYNKNLDCVGFVINKSKSKWGEVRG